MWKQARDALVLHILEGTVPDMALKSNDDNAVGIGGQIPASQQVVHADWQQIVLVELAAGHEITIEMLMATDQGTGTQ